MYRNSISFDDIFSIQTAITALVYTISFEIIKYVWKHRMEVSRNTRFYLYKYALKTDYVIINAFERTLDHFIDKENLRDNYVYLMIFRLNTKSWLHLLHVMVRCTTLNIRNHPKFRDLTDEEFEAALEDFKNRKK